MSKTTAIVLYSTLTMVLTVSAVYGMAANMTSPGGRGYPPVSIEDETILHDPIFSQACIARIRALAGQPEWIIEKGVTTRSIIWGAIWRADIKSGDPALAEANLRAICWKSEGDTKLQIMIVSVEPPAS